MHSVLLMQGVKSPFFRLAMAGGYWNEGGGHSSGRKWPILFASIMLDNPEITDLPETAVFQEDTQTYYSKGWFGQTALWQMIMHHGKRDTYEEKPPEQWEKAKKESGYPMLNKYASSWMTPENHLVQRFVAHKPLNFSLCATGRGEANIFINA